MNYTKITHFALSFAALAFLLSLAMCDNEQPVVTEPPIDGSKLHSWRIDTLLPPDETGGLNLECMLVIDTNHIVVGGHSLFSVRPLLELVDDSIIYRNVAAAVYDLALAAEGFYSCEGGSWGQVTHHLNGKKTHFRIETGGDAAYYIYRRTDGTYFVGVVRSGIYRFDGAGFQHDTVAARLNGQDQMFYFTDFAEHKGSNYATAVYYIRDGAEEKGYLLKETSPRRWEYIDSCSYAWDESLEKPHFGTQKLRATKDGTLFSVGAGGAFRMRDDETWESLVRMKLGAGIGGTSSKDMYFGSNDGHFYYYDGSAVKELSIPTLSPKTFVVEIVVIGRKIFILTQDYGKDVSYVLRGER